MRSGEAWADAGSVHEIGKLPYIVARAGPIVLWELIYPGDPGRVTTFALLQHNFFIALLGLVRSRTLARGVVLDRREETYLSE